MNKKMFFVLSALVTFSMAGVHTASAQRVSKVKAGEFLQLCQKSETVKACNIYISGIADSVAFSKIYAKNKGDAKAPVGFCIAPSTPGNEMRKKVVDWMNSHTDQLNEPAGAAVFTALHEAYPCKIETNGME